MLNMFAAMAQFEREMMLERQREGIAKCFDRMDGKVPQSVDTTQVRGRPPTGRLLARND